MSNPALTYMRVRKLEGGCELYLPSSTGAPTMFDANEQLALFLFDMAQCSFETKLALNDLEMDAAALIEVLKNGRNLTPAEINFHVNEPRCGTSVVVGIPFDLFTPEE